MSTLKTERDAHHPCNETDEDEDYPMPHRYADASASDREISLGTGTILAIFFALVLVCSVFFGFGYTIGHRSVVPSTVATSTVPSHSLADTFKSFKPSPGGPAPATSATPAPTETDDSSLTAPRKTVVVPTTSVTANSAPSVTSATAAIPKKPFDPDAEIVTAATPSTTAKSAASAHPSPAVRTSPGDTSQASAPASPAPVGIAIVQVAAVSHQEDADTMIAALKRKGYTVGVHHEPQDKLLHIQLGPYPTRKDAEAMRQRLQGDGFNSILK